MGFAYQIWRSMIEMQFDACGCQSHLRDLEIGGVCSYYMMERVMFNLTGLGVESRQLWS